jgi:hypothetical protein
MNAEQWDKVFLVTNEFGKENFSKRVKTDKPVEYIVLDFDKEIPDLIASIIKSIDGKISDFEVALSIISGEGKEHTAVISALIKAGLSFRLVALDSSGKVFEV